jgi:hypothetical protein
MGDRVIGDYAPPRVTKEDIAYSLERARQTINRAHEARRASIVCRQRAAALRQKAERARALAR